MREVFVVRHGETHYNVENRYCGSTEVELNENGIEQAKVLGQKLADCKIDIIVCSKMKRAIQTANVIASQINKQVVIYDGIQERCMGVYERLTKEEIQEKYPEMWSRKCTRQYDDAPSEGETIRTVEERVYKALDEINNDFHDKNILIVTHGFITRMINRYFTNVEWKQFHDFSMNNCEVRKYEIE